MDQTILAAWGMRVVRRIGGGTCRRSLWKLALLRQQLEFIGNPTQLCQRSEPHLAHHVEAMNLDRTLADAHIGGNLLVEPPPRYLGEYAEFTGREGLESGPESAQRFMLLAPGTIASEPEIDCVEKVLVAERLREELDGAPFHRLH